jgi:hypothetical protein
LRAGNYKKTIEADFKILRERLDNIRGPAKGGTFGPAKGIA